MSKSRVVIWPNGVNPLYLTGACYKDGEVIEGYVENGDWLYRRVGQEHQACYAGDRRRVVNRWPVTGPTDVVEVTEHADYSDVIGWAETQR